MGFRLNFSIEREKIDDNWFTPSYSEEIKITGNSITDTLCFEQDGQFVGFTRSQFLELMDGLRKSSIWCEIEEHFRYNDSEGD